MPQYQVWWVKIEPEDFLIEAESFEEVEKDMKHDAGYGEWFLYKIEEMSPEGNVVNFRTYDSGWF